MLIRAIAVVLWFFISLPAQAATITSASTSRADVGTAYDLTSDGDTLEIPAGTSTWTSQLTVTKAIAIQGAGMDSTIIRDGMSGPTALLPITIVANKTTRLSGIEFNDNGRSEDVFNGVIQLIAGGYDNRRVVVTSCRFKNLRGVSIFTTDAIGVISGCQFENTDSTIFVYVYHENWDGFTYSDGSFADPPDFGSQNFLFIENNGFAYNGVFYAITDAYRGARYVGRFNKATNSWWEAHGTDSGNRRRGTRAIEIYGNTHVYTLGGAHDVIVNMRSATGVIYNNTASGYSSTPQITLGAYRLRATFQPFSYADGDSRWDDNDSASPHVTGTASSGTGLTMTDSGKSWTTDQWIGYSLRNLTTGRSSMITANTATVLTFLDAGGFSPGNMAFSMGDSYEINLVEEVMDQPGKGQGTQLLAKTITTQTHSGGTVTCTVTGHGYSTGDWVGIADTEPAALNITAQITVTGSDTFTYALAGSSTVTFPGTSTKVPAGWPDQVDEPIYEWDNTHGVSNIGYSVLGTQIRVTEHYVADTVKPGYAAFTYPHPLTVDAIPGRGRSHKLKNIRLK